ncbi:NAD-binding protein [Curtobacterium flaccumfaciens]|nr:NAD-binding protein [Curtobacterium flaccumfaciens]
MCNQVVVAGTLAALAEAIELADAAGLDTVQVVRVLEGGLASSAVLRAKQRNLVDHDHRPGGSLRNQVKDLDHALALAASVGAWTPQTTAARATFGTALDAGMGDLDHSAVQEVLVPAGSSHRYGSITKADGSANDSTNS